MTLVVGKQYLDGLILIAESRASIKKNGAFIPWRDNTQKIFPLSEDLYLGFSGDIECAGSIIGFLLQQIARRPLLGKLHIFYQKAPKLLRYAYKVFSKEAGEREVGFIMAGLDPQRPEPIKDKGGKITGYVDVYDKKLFKISFPDEVFEESIFPQNLSLIMGSGSPAAKEQERSLKKISFGPDSLGAYFQASIMDFVLRKKIKELGIHSVGGLSQIVIIKPGSSGFLQYRGKSNLEDKNDILDVELILRDNRLIQRNLITKKETPLLTPPEVIKIKDPTTDLFADIDSPNYTTSAQ